MGAQESNAGDDFHVLWVASRALELLKPGSSLLRLKVEGVALQGEAGDDERFLAADVTEHHGSGTHSRCRVLQLKYATKHPDRPWTAGDLCKSHSKRGTKAATSVIARLAQTYSELLAAGVTASSLELVLVSNRSVDSKVAEALRAHREGGVLSKAQQKTLDRIRAESGLGVQADKFLQVLEMPKDAERSRLRLRLQFVTELSSISYHPTRALDALKKLVQQETLPDAANSAGLTKADILAAVGAREESVFPAPRSIAAAGPLIDTPNAPDLASAVGAADARRLLAHGAAGIGKTTAVMSLESRLPPHSRLIVFDCYGGGTHLDVGRERHTVRRAVLQILNELLVGLGAAPVLQAPEHDEDLWLWFQQAVESAAATLGKQGGLLVIAADAADNSVAAAQSAGQSSFVHKLWQIGNVPNVRVLMTARSSRKQALEVPRDTIEVQLRPFDLAASSRHLRTVCPASDSSCQNLHEHTGGNPRVQKYLLENFTDIESTLTRARQTPESLFQDLFEHALTFPSPENRPCLTELLVVMPRPVGVVHLARAAGLTEERVRAWVQELRPGLRTDDGSIRFRDEDFESFVVDRIKADTRQAAHAYLGQLHYQDRLVDAFAARHVAFHLFRGQRMDEVIELALDADDLVVLEDPIDRMFFRHERLVLGLRAALHQERQEDALRALILLSGLDAVNQLTITLTRQNPDLALLLGEPYRVRGYALEVADGDDLAWGHLDLAGAFSRREHLRDLVKEHLRIGREGIAGDRLLESDGRLRPRARVSLGRGAEAVLRTTGARSARRWVRGLPRAAGRVEVAASMGHSISSDAKIHADDLAQTLSPFELYGFVAGAYQSGWLASQSMVNDISRCVDLACARSDLRSQLGPLVPWFVELMLRVGCDHGVARNILARLLPDVGPRDGPLGPRELPRAVAWTRARCLLAALSREEPDRTAFAAAWHVDMEPGRGESAQPLHRLEPFGLLLQSCHLLARSLIGTITLEVAEEELGASLDKRTEYPRRLMRETGWRFAHSMVPAVEAVLHLAGQWRPIVDRIVAIADGLGSWQGRLVRRQVAAVLAHDRRFDAPFRRLVFELRERIGSIADRAERAGELLDCAALLAKQDEAHARELVSEAFQLVASPAAFSEVTTRIATALVDASAEDGGGDLDSALLDDYLALVERSNVVDSRTGMRRHAAQAVLRHDPLRGLAAGCRWAAEDHSELAYFVIKFAEHAATRGEMPVLQAMSLARAFAGPYDTRWWPPLLDVARDAGVLTLGGAIELVADSVLRDTFLGGQRMAVRSLRDWLTRHGRAALPILATLERSCPATSDEGRWERQREEHREVTRGIVRQHAQNADDLLKALDVTHDPGDWDEVARLVISAHPSSRLPAFVNSLLSAMISPVVDSQHSRRAAELVASLLRQPSAPQDYLRDARRRAIELVERNLINLRRDESALPWTVPRLLEAALLEPKRRLEALLRGLDGASPYLSSSELSAVAEAATRWLSPTARRSLLAWLLRQHRADRPSPGSKASDAPTLAGYFRAMLGHPDTRIRWRAAHAIRGIVRCGDRRLAPALLAIADREQAYPFVPRRLTFYAMSARVWTMMIVARVAHETPESLRDCISTIAEHALSRSFPHAQLRAFATRALESLAARFPQSVDAGELAMARGLTHPIGHRDEEPLRFQKTDSDAEVQTGFFISALDTIPYWYEPLARIFGVPSSTVTRRAHEWITKRWAITEHQADEDPWDLQGQFEYNDYSNYHGTIPRVEDPSTYFEYHAMMLVAGDLLARQPVVRSTHDDSCPWTDWLSRHLDYSPSAWLFDLRGATPPDISSQGQEDPRTFEQPPLDGEFDRALGLVAGNLGTTLVVSAEYTRADARGREVWTSISSSLVSAPVARDLATALSSHSPDRTRLPLQQPDRPDDFESRFPGFVLEPWLRRQDRAGSYLDELDPLARKVTDFAVVGGADVEDWASHQNAGPGIFECQRWSEASIEEKTRDAHSKGSRLVARVSEVQSYLAHRRMSLILRVHLTRYRSGDTLESFARNYLMSPTGEFTAADTADILGARLGSMLEARTHGGLLVYWLAQRTATLLGQLNLARTATSRRNTQSQARASIRRLANIVFWPADLPRAPNALRAKLVGMTTAAAREVISSRARARASNRQRLVKLAATRKKGR